jgi:transcriptional regulator with XRE-family HTH domain
VETQPPATFGALLRRYRVAAGLTQAALAAQAGLAERSISDLERGVRRSPHRDTLALLTEALQLAPEDRAHFEAAARGPGTPRRLPGALAASGEWSPDATPHRAGPIAPIRPISPMWLVPSRRRASDTVPTPLTPLIGREAEVGAVCALLRRPEVRVLTLTGTAGVGKTRLALQAAAEVVDAFADGVWFVRLSQLRDPGLVLATIAQTLGVPEQAGRPLIATLCTHVRDQQLLLVLDNCEQVVEAASELGALLEGTAGLRILVTSRAPLRLRGEHRFPVSPLALPAPEPTVSPERLAACAAVALFVARARAVRPDFVLTVDNGRAVAEMCTRLDGVPLALELAAARLTLLPPEALLARLAAQLPLLSGGARDLETHQRTMRGRSDRLRSEQGA